MRIILLVISFVLFLQNNSHALTNVQEYPQLDLEDPCQFVMKRDFILTDLANLFTTSYSLPLSWGNEGLPVRFYIDSNMPELLIDPIHETVSEMNTKLGFEAVRIEGTYEHDEGVIISTYQINTKDQKNVIYWGSNLDNMFNNPNILAFMLPDAIASLYNLQADYLKLSETNIVINGFHPNLIIQTQEMRNRETELIEMFQEAGLEIPPDYLKDFETFTETGNIIVNFIQNATVEEIRNLVIRPFEFERQNLDTINLDNEYARQLAEARLDQVIENIRNTPSEQFEISRDQIIANIGNENFFSRFNFEIATQRVNQITHFKNVLKHEIGHALGLDHPYDERFLSSTEQIPLMWHTIGEGIDIDNPAPYFDNPLEIDSLALHALSCTYDLDALRQQTQP